MIATKFGGGFPTPLACIEDAGGENPPLHNCRIFSPSSFQRHVLILLP
jgi:hypothetical protein